MNLEDIDVQRLKLLENDTLVITIKRGNLSSSAWDKHADSVREVARVYFLTNRILIMDDGISLSVLEQGETK